MTSLYEIAENYRSVMEIEGVDINDTLDAIEGEFEIKACNVARIIINADAEIAMIKAEIERLKVRLNGKEAMKDNLRTYLRDNMERIGIRKIDSDPIFDITLAAGRDVVVVNDVELLPDDYVRVKTTIEPDKPALLEALKVGEVPGAILEKSKSSVRIK